MGMKLIALWKNKIWNNILLLIAIGLMLFGSYLEVHVLLIVSATFAIILLCLTTLYYVYLDKEKNKTKA